MPDAIDNTRRTQDIQRDETPLAAAPPTRRDAVDVLAHVNIDYGAITSVAPPSPNAIAQSKLDAYQAEFAGPYKVDGASVSALPQFRMANGYNDAAAGYSRKDGKSVIDYNSPRVKELMVAREAAQAPWPIGCLMGAPTAHDLVAVTQALIDAGKLGPGPDVATRIKDMQWKYGIGIDCTDYVIGAALKATGKSRADVTFVSNGTQLPFPGCDYFDKADSNPHLARVSVASARPGDVFCLDAPGAVGHRAVVYSNNLCDANKVSEIGKRYGAAATAFFASGNVRAIEVDASWGAGEHGAPHGGVRRDTWFHDDSTGQWAQINVRVTPITFEVTSNGPASELLHGLYRFK